MSNELQRQQAIFFKLRQAFGPDYNEDEMLIILSEPTVFHAIEATNDLRNIRQICDNAKIIFSSEQAPKPAAFTSKSSPSHKIAPVPQTAQISGNLPSVASFHDANINDIDICFLFSCNKSLEPWYRDFATVIRDVTNNLRNSCVSGIRLGFVGYRHFVDCHRIEFTDNLDGFVDGLKYVLQYLQPLGSLQQSYGILSEGLNSALTMSWKNRTRMLFHLNDVPSDDTLANNINSASSSSASSSSVLAQHLKKCQQANINYHYVATSTSTYNNMKLTLTSSLPPSMSIPRHKAGSLQDLSDIIVESIQMMVVINNSVLPDYMKPKGNKPLPAAKFKVSPSASASASVSAFAPASVPSSASASAPAPAPAPSLAFASNNDQRKIKSMNFKEQIPEWRTINVSQCNQISIVTPTNWQSIKSEQFTEKEKSISIKVPYHYFAEGKERFAMYGLQMMDDGTTENLVLKVAKFAGKEYNSKAVYLQYVKNQMVARAIAKWYNANKPVTAASIIFSRIQYVDRTVIVKNKNDPSSTYSQHFLYTMEKVLPSFERFTNNYGGVSDKADDSLLAFSHYSYIASDGFLMVTDLQGHYNQNTKEYKLTDPAIHSIKYYDVETNVGKEGFKAFFESHVCNSICKAMNLPPVSAKQFDV